jgi:diaminohydroxyphosphoribosylaminopyrimidine deaminase/5-amino-6-(5-phosphoribosylamino)uracil reductase
MTLDGKIADPSGHSKWITSEDARAAAHRLRAEVDAVVVGRRTAELDDPALTVRLAEGRNPARVVLDSRGELPLRLALFSDGVARTVRVTREGTRSRPGAFETWTLPADDRGHPDAHSLLERAAGEGWRHLLVEGGPSLIASLMRLNLVDRLYLFVAPRVLGAPAAPSWVGDLEIQNLVDAHEFVFERSEPVGRDLLLVLSRAPNPAPEGGARGVARPAGGSSCSPD